MAQSPAHKFGQIVGGLIETTVEPLLRQFAQEQSLYLDKAGPRPTRRGKKVSWTDMNGNKHDLDFVLERDGSAKEIGIPVAFIETAWRRYTKHSRNKAQEIQGAIQPLVETYQHAHPFVGTVLAGIFTDSALTQLRSLGFAVLYFPYDTIIEAFRRVGIDAHFDEATPDAEVATKIHTWEAMPALQHRNAARALSQLNRKQISEFMGALRRTITRRIELVRILPLHGTSCELPSLQAAIEFVQAYNEVRSVGSFARYEIEIRYNNGDLIVGRFTNKQNAIDFLSMYLRTP